MGANTSGLSWTQRDGLVVTGGVSLRCTGSLGLGCTGLVNSLVMPRLGESKGRGLRVASSPTASCRQGRHRGMMAASSPKLAAGRRG